MTGTKTVLIADPAELVAAIRRFRLLEPAQLAELCSSMLPRHAEPRALARDLLERSWLTPFQLNQLMHGAGADLQLGQYTLLERLREGSLGQVYKAKHQVMKRLVALQLVREELLAQPGTVERFYSEIQAVSRLSHPGLVETYDAGPVGRSHFVALEFVSGVDLHRLVTQSGPLSVSQASCWVLQVASVLRYAWGLGVRHHDLKPANLLLMSRRSTASDASAATLNSFSGFSMTEIALGSFVGGNRTSSMSMVDMTGSDLIKVRNLGLSLLEHHTNPGVASVGSSPGLTAQPTPTADPTGFNPYQAPEVRTDPHGADIRADLYSLGGIFFFLLTGKAPAGPGNGRTAYAFVDGEPRQLEQLAPYVPEALAALIGRLLAEQPDHRFQTPAQVCETLTELIFPPSPSNAANEEDAVGGEILGGLSASSSSSFADLSPHSGTLVIGESAVISLALDQPAKEPVVRAASFWPFVLVGGGFVSSVLLLLSWFWLGTNVTPPTPPRSLATSGPPKLTFHKRPTRTETILTTLRANHFPTLEGTWYVLGPFDNPKGKGFSTAYPPEQGVDLGQTYTGKGDQPIKWRDYSAFRLGKVTSLSLFGDQNDNSVAYVYHEFEVPEAVDLPLALGSDDTLTVWLNGEKLLANDVSRGAEPDSDWVTLPLKAGTNKLLLKICNGSGEFACYALPQFPEQLERAFGKSLKHNFPGPTPR